MSSHQFTTIISNLPYGYRAWGIVNCTPGNFENNVPVKCKVRRVGKTQIEDWRNPTHTLPIGSYEVAVPIRVPKGYRRVEFLKDADNESVIPTGAKFLWVENDDSKWEDSSFQNMSVQIGRAVAYCIPAQPKVKTWTNVDGVKYQIINLDSHRAGILRGSGLANKLPPVPENYAAWRIYVLHEDCPTGSIFRRDLVIFAIRTTVTLWTQETAANTWAEVDGRLIYAEPVGLKNLKKRVRVPQKKLAAPDLSASHGLIKSDHLPDYFPADRKGFGPWEKVTKAHMTRELLITKDFQVVAWNGAFWVPTKWSYWNELRTDKYPYMFCQKLKTPESTFFQWNSLATSDIPADVTFEDFTKAGYTLHVEVKTSGEWCQLDWTTDIVDIGELRELARESRLSIGIYRS